MSEFRNYRHLRLETDERPVVLTGPDGAELGRGLSDKSSTELKTGERSGVVIHRNNLFLRD